VRLTIGTPLELVVDRDDVAHVRAEDATGAFGILARHADFLTVLPVSVVSYCDLKGREHHVAVREGMLEVRGGNLVSIATREAVPGDDLAKLKLEVVERFQLNAKEERSARLASEQLYLSAIRRIYSLVRSEHSPGRLFEAKR